MGTYNVHGGHNSIVPGAAKYLNEVTEDRKVKNKVISLLRAAGHTVYDCTDGSGRTQSKNLANIVAKCNKHNVDLDISIHLNAGGGTGVEVLYTSSSGKAWAEKVSKAVASVLGIRNRGSKKRDNLYVLNHTKATAILVECCFVDSQTDKNTWDVDKCAKAIVEAVTGKTVSSGSTGSSSSASKPSASGSAKKLKVDGKWGVDTTTRLQQIFGTTVDGKISNQYACYKADNPGLLSETFEWEDDPSGYSPLIKKLQKYIGMLEDEQDGHIGPKLIRGLQKYFGTVQDGKVSAVSPMVKALQEWCNKQ